MQERGEETVLKMIIERAADPRDFVTKLEKLKQVLSYLNQFLVIDGYELRHSANAKRFTQAQTEAPVVSALESTLQTIDFDSVGQDLERALEAVETDAESAVMLAYSVIESVCRSIIVELNTTAMPAKLDIKGLRKAVYKLLNLSPGRDNLPAPIADDVRTILRGLNTVIRGVGALPTHAGAAHGRERGFRRIYARLARLAVHAASTTGQFLIETWQRKPATVTSRSLRLLGKSQSFRQPLHGVRAVLAAIARENCCKQKVDWLRQVCGLEVHGS